MAIEVIAHYLYEHKMKSKPKKLLLIALADRANRDTGEAFPGVKTLADVVEVVPRRIQQMLVELVDEGELLIKYNDAKIGQQWTNRYYLLSYRAKLGLPLPKVSGMRAGKVKKPKAKPAAKGRKRDPLFEAIAQYVFLQDPQEIPSNIGGMIGRVNAWLSGKKGRFKIGGRWFNPDFISRPAQPQHVQDFVTDWETTHRGATPPQDIEKFIKHWRTWAASKSGRLSSTQPDPEPEAQTPTVTSNRGDNWKDALKG